MDTAAVNRIVRDAVQNSLHLPPPCAQESEVTRLLGGAAYLEGPRFRTRILDFFCHRYDAVAPECGLNVNLLVRICLKANRLQARYDTVFAGATVAALVALLSGTATLFALAVLLGSLAHASLRSAMRRHAAEFRRDRFNLEQCHASHTDVDVPTEIADALPDANQNLILYGGFLPFVGAGAYEGGWSFNCALTQTEPASAGRPLLPFTAQDLYAHIHDRLETLRIPGIHMADRIFVSGREARSADDLCRGVDIRPLQSVGLDQLRACVGASDTRMRHYLCLQIADWGGEIVTSYFIRFVVRANGLYVEFSRFFLGPVDEPYRSVERLHEGGVGARLLRLGGDLVTGPFATVAAAVRVGGDLVSWVARLVSADPRRRRRMRRVRDECNYNYGADTSLRESLSGLTLRHYFQRSDEDFNRKLIERNLLDEIAHFLEAHGVDSSDIRERRTTILNNGIIVNGGDVNANALAVGKGAKAKQSTSAKAATT